MFGIYLQRDRFIWLGLLPILFGLAAGSVLPRAGAQPLGRAAPAQNAKQPPAKSRPARVPARAATKPGVRPAESPIIEFATPVYNFGRVLAGKPVRHDFRFANRGNQTLLITQVKPSCGCAKAGPYDKKVAPGKSGKIPISLNTSRLEGKIRKSVDVTTNDPGLATLRLQLSGEIVPLLKVDPPSVFFRALQDDVKQTRVLKIVNNLDKPLEFTSIKYDSAKFKTQLKLKTVKPGKEFELTVTALPPFESGSVRGAIFLQTNLPEMPVVTISVSGYRPLPVTVTPKLVSLPFPIPKDFRRQIFVRHTKGHALKLTDLKVSGEGLKVSLQDAQPGVQLYHIILSGPAGYQAPKTGEQITFKTDDPSMPQVTVPVVQYQSRPVPKGRPAIKRGTDRADSILKFAKRLLDKGDQKTAEKWLRRLIDRFPKSEAAKEAKKLLDPAAQ